MFSYKSAPQLLSWTSIYLQSVSGIQYSTIFCPYLFVRRFSHHILYNNMFFQQPSLSALGAITLLVHASTCFAGHNRHPHRPRNNDLAVVDRRQALGMTEVSTGELNLLHSEMTTFRGWMNAWFDSTATADPGAAVAQLKQEFQAYDSWITAWMDATMGTGAPAPPPVFASVPLPASQHASVGPSSAETTSPVAVVTLSTASFVAPITTAASVPASSPAAPQSSPPYPTTSAAVGPSTSAASGSSAPVASTAPGSPGSGSPGGSFSAQSSSNVAVYYGQSGATGEVSLSQLCSNSNADIVILAFLTQYFSTGNYPTLNFGAACAGNSPQMLAKGASGLLSCPQMAKDIATCQGKGKKVLLSLGGAEAVTAFSSTTQAQQFAVQLWNLFGAGTGEDKALRPFGDVLIDGFDLGKSNLRRESTKHLLTPKI